jgi:hypothetical protein
MPDINEDIHNCHIFTCHRKNSVGGSNAISPSEKNIDYNGDIRQFVITDHLSGSFNQLVSHLITNDIEQIVYEIEVKYIDVGEGSWKSVYTNKYIVYLNDKLTFRGLTTNMEKWRPTDHLEDDNIVTDEVDLRQVRE